MKVMAKTSKSKELSYLKKVTTLPYGNYEIGISYINLLINLLISILGLK